MGAVIKAAIVWLILSAPGINRATGLETWNSYELNL